MNQPLSLTWTVSAASEQGRREENQDRMTRFPSPFGEVVAVADGMGGMRGGATAAAAVVRRLPEILNATPPNTPAPDALRLALRAINEEVYRQGHNGDPSVANMGTTIVLALLRPGGETIVANIGDSRAYLFRNGALQQLTRDHSAVQRLVDAGAITAEQARVHPESSVLTRAIGQQPEVQLEVYPPFRLEPNDGLLLCSDGLSGFTGSESISAVLRQIPDPAAAVTALGALALQSGSDDNITIQYLRANSPAVAAPPPAKPRNWYSIAGMAAAAVLATVSVSVLTRDAAIPALEITITNGTGQISPKQTNEKPSVTAPKKKPLTVIFSPAERPTWLKTNYKLDCSEVRQRPSSERKGQYKNYDKSLTHILYRPESAAAKDCLINSIPELATARIVASTKIPPEVDIIVLLPEPKREEEETKEP